MKEPDLLDAMVQVKRLGNLLHEILDLSSQLAEAVDREDEVSVRMLLAMRQEPIEKLKAADTALREQKKRLPEEDGQRLGELLNGGPGSTPGERRLAELVASNRRLMKRVEGLDQAINRKLAREKSVYSARTVKR